MISALLFIAGIIVFSAMPAAADLTVEPITWNIIGLDSSNVNVGPNQFPVGVRVHNTGTTNATNVVAAFVWDSTNTNINLYPSTPTTAAIGTIVGGSYKDAYFTVEVTRNAAAYDTARRYHINVTASGLPGVSTPTPRELYVERLTSESLNSEVAFTLDGAIIPPGGAINLMVDPNVTHTIVLTGTTYPQGYGQLEQFIALPGGVFSITSVNTTYTMVNSPYVTSPYKAYADACGWENDPNDPNYRSCVGGYYDYRAGGTVTTTLKFKVLKLPSSPLPNPVNISPLIYNFFNESYQYNSDYNASARVAYITDPAQIQVSKNFVPDNISSGGISTLTFIITNPTDNIISGVYLKDTFPAGIVVATTPNVEIYGCGTSWTFTGGVSGSTAVWITNATIAAHGTGTIKLDVTGTAPSGQIQTFANTTDPLYINGTTNTGLTASSGLTVGNTTNTCVSVPVIAQWQVPNHATNPPDKQVGTTAGCPTVQHSSTLTATADAGIPSQTTIAGTGSGDGHSWEIWATGSAGNYVEFNIDTRNYSQIKMSFAAKRQDNDSATKLKIYYNNGFGAQQNGDDLSITNDKDWHTHAGVNQLDFTGKTNTSGITTFRIQPVGTDNDSRLCFDNITFSGVTCTPPPIFTKYFDPDSILVTNPGSPDVSRLSLLTFTISNTQSSPNASQTLQNVYFRDILPGVLQIYNNSGDPAHQPVTCDGSTLTADHLQQEINFSKPTMAPGEICTAKVYVMGTVADNVLHINTTDPITCTGIPPDNKNRASANITVRDLTPGVSILKQVSSTGLDGSWRSYVAVPEGGNVYYKFTVENTGDVPLTDVTITDPPGGTVIYSWGATSLPVGGSVNYVSLPIAASLGTHVNTAQASGTYSGTPYTDTGSATYATAELVIVKIAEADHYSQEGEVLHYTYTVANTGYAPLKGPVTVVDDIAESESCQDLTAIGDHDNYLDVGEHVTCTAAYTVKDVDVGLPIINTAYATADSIISDSVQATVDYLAYEADVEVVKTCEGLVPGNQQLVYVITVTNNGPNPAEDVVLEDDFTDPFTDGLSSIQYSVDGGTRVSLPDGGDHQLSLSLGDMSLAETHSVKIYANVPAGFLSSNTASITSTTSDPVLANNTSTCASVETVAKQKALEFPQADTSSYYVSVGDDDSLDLSAAGTLEAWIYPQTAFVPDAGVVFKGSSANGICYGFGFGGGSNVFTGGTSAAIGFVIENSAGARYLLTATRESLKLNHWYHVACVWNAAKEVKMIIYINGLVEAARIIDIGGGARINNDDLVFGTRDILTPAVNFRGVMDEVRVWSTDRTRIQIRDYMCKKLTGTEANLVGYWRFDEESGPCMDTSPNGNNGATNATRICSEAPMGDASLWDYTGIDPEDFTRNLTSPNGDYITVTGDGGTWSVPLRSGLQVYRVDGPPTPATAPIGQKSFKSAPHYWGVFMTGGTDPTYKIVYNYLGYPGITNEDALELDYRNHNCENWKDSHATLDAEEDTLTRTGLSGTEFILGADQDPRNTIIYDGVDDYVDVTDHASLDLTTDGTLEAWIYIINCQNAGIINKVNGANGYSLSIDSSCNVLFSLSNFGPPTIVTSTISLDAYTWYHIAATWDTGGVMSLYINGILDNTGSGGQSGNPLSERAAEGLGRFCPGEAVPSRGAQYSGIGAISGSSGRLRGERRLHHHGICPHAQQTASRSRDRQICGSHYSGRGEDFWHGCALSSDRNLFLQRPAL